MLFESGGEADQGGVGAGVIEAGREHGEVARQRVGAGAVAGDVKAGVPGLGEGRALRIAIVARLQVAPQRVGAKHEGPPVAVAGVADVELHIVDLTVTAAVLHVTAEGRGAWFVIVGAAAGDPFVRLAAEKQCRRRHAGVDYVGVVAAAAAHRVDPAPAHQRVVAGAALQHVVAGGAIENIVADAAGDAVGESVAGEVRA